MAYRIGLTGNIGVGKSTVACLLAELGAEVIDADRVAHALMAPHTAEWERIVARFGQAILRADDTIDRQRLGAIVFRDPDALRDLERILHPSVRQQIRAHFATTTASVIVVEAIKLFESGLYREVDAVWVVAAAREQQIARLVATRGLTPAEAALRVDAQPPQAEKIARADVVIWNDGDLAATRAQVLAAWAAVEAGTAPHRRGEPR
ncbi:MAG: dephospho-CoA kinase [Chloroflexi bacterium]|nr:dephospho-CoA kinase [Chloroflexota bacterium]